MKKITVQLILCLGILIFLFLGKPETALGGKPFNYSAVKCFSISKNIPPDGLEIEVRPHPSGKPNYWEIRFINNSDQIVALMTFTYTVTVKNNKGAIVTLTQKRVASPGNSELFSSIFSLSKPQVSVKDVKYKEGANRCTSLAEYRDKGLFRQWERLRKQYEIRSGVKQDMKRIKQELLSDTNWHRSDGSLAVGVIASNLKITANLIENLVSLTPAGKAPGAVIDTGKVTANRIYNLLKTGKSINDVVEDGFLKVVVKDVLEKQGDFGKLAKTFWELGEDVKKMTDLKSQQDELRTVIKDQLAALDKKIAEYDLQMQNFREQMNVIEEVKTGIDSYCLSQSGSQTNPNDTTGITRVSPAKPSVQDLKLKNITNDLYKGASNPNRVGSGSTADAVRSELKTNQVTQGKFHSQKAREYVSALDNWLQKNPGASVSDRKAAQMMRQDLLDALNGN